MPNNDYANEPNQSRSEDIIQSILDNTEYNEDAGSRIEYLLIELKNAIEGGGGGGGGVTSYSPLTEKPKIDNHTLQAGNNTSSDLGLQTKLTFDSAPTESSTNPVTSGGVYTALAAKANAADVYNKSSVDTALSNKADKSTTYTKSEVDTALSSKQNTISDLSTIRSGAALGATAVQPISGKGLSTNDYTNDEKTKLAGIAEGAEVNVQSDWEQTDNTADDYIKGKPTIPTVNDSTITIQKNGTTVKSFTTNQASGDTIDITVPTSAADVSAIPTSAKGTASGVAELDSNGKVPSSQLPSYVDDVIEGYYYNGKFYEESAHTTEITGETGKIYIDLSGTNKTYRWSGSGYTEISESLALGETSSTAYRGDRGKTAYDHATESRLTTATESGLYKVASTAEGHIASLTSVQKSDITALGIPTQDTTYTFEGTYNASTNKAATMADIKDGKLTGYTQGSGNVAATDKVVEAIGKVEKKADDNKNNILLIEERNPMYNIFNFKLWANECTVYKGTKTVKENSITLTATNNDCITQWSASTFPIEARVSASAGDKVVLLWESDNTTGTAKGNVWIFANGLNAGGTSIHAEDNLGIISWTCPAGTTFLTFGFGVTTNGDSIKYSNIRLIPKSLYDAGFTDYQPYAMSNAELTAKEQTNENNISFAVEKIGNNLVNSPSGSGVRWVDVTVNIPPGVYTLGFSNLSGDDSRQSQVSFYSGDSSFYTSIDKGNDVYINNVTFTNTVTTIRIYASTNSTTSYNQGVNFTNLFLCKQETWNSSVGIQPYAMSNAELTAKEQTNENNILSLWDNGAKNHYKITSTQSTTGITYSKVSESELSINGTYTASTYVYFNLTGNNFKLPAGAWKFRFTTTGTVPNRDITFGIQGQGNTTARKDTDYEFTTTGEEYLTAYIQFLTNDTVDGSICIMVRPANATDPSYQPYAPSNRELYEMILAMQ